MSKKSEDLNKIYKDLKRQYEKNIKQINIIQDSPSVDMSSDEIQSELDTLVSENNGILMQLNDLQNKVTNENYALQQDLSVLGEELNDVQIKNKQLKNKLKDLKDKSLSTKGLEEQTTSMYISKFIFLILKLLLLLLLIYIIYRVQFGTSPVSNVSGALGAAVAVSSNEKLRNTDKGNIVNKNKKSNSLINYNNNNNNNSIN